MIDNKTCSDVVFALKDDNDQQVHANKGILIKLWLKRASKLSSSPLIVDRFSSISLLPNSILLISPVITLDPIFDHTSEIGIICRFDGRSPNSGSGTSSY